MKKYAALGTIYILFIFMLTSCCGEKYAYEKTEFEATVVKCEKGEFHPNAEYLATANMYQAQQNYSMWTMYSNLANINGTYDYIVTINIDDNNYTVIREEQYNCGETITITKINTYDGKKMINTEYK